MENNYKEVMMITKMMMFKCFHLKLQSLLVHVESSPWNVTRIGRRTTSQFSGIWEQVLRNDMGRIEGAGSNKVRRYDCICILWQISKLQIWKNTAGKSDNARKPKLLAFLRRAPMPYLIVARDEVWNAGFYSCFKVKEGLSLKVDC